MNRELERAVAEIRIATRKEPQCEMAWTVLLETRIFYHNQDRDGDTFLDSLVEDTEDMMKNCPNIQTPLSREFLATVARILFLYIYSFLKEKFNNTCHSPGININILSDTRKK